MVPQTRPPSSTALLPCAAWRNVHDSGSACGSARLGSSSAAPACNRTMAAAASSSPQQKPQPPQQGWTATRFGIVRRPVLPNLVVTAEGAGSHNPSPRARSDAVKDANCDGATQPQDASKEAVLLLKASSSTSPRRRNITHTRRRTDIDVRHEAVPVKQPA
eukprot:6183980-Pleurochrysis_carterae.AAC.1